MTGSTNSQADLLVAIGLATVASLLAIAIVLPGVTVFPTAGVHPAMTPLQTRLVYIGVTLGGAGLFWLDHRDAASPDRFGSR